MNEQRLIPKDKFDLDAAKRLSLATPEQVSVVATSILEWIADMNYPVALEIIHVLPKFHKELLPSIKQILVNQENDTIWKYWIISQLLIQFPQESLLTLLPIKKLKHLAILPRFLKKGNEEKLKEMLPLLNW